MFTGIVRPAGIRKAEKRGAILRVSIAAPRGWTLAKGASVAVDGICSTVVGKNGGAFMVEYMPETLRLTTAASFAPGRIVNLEEPLRLGATLDGHLVQGHVDGVGTVTRVATRGGAHEVAVRVPADVRPFLARKGSIAINGVALTVARVRGVDATTSK